MNSASPNTSETTNNAAKSKDAAAGQNATTQQKTQQRIPIRVQQKQGVIFFCYPVCVCVCLPVCFANLFFDGNTQAVIVLSLLRETVDWSVLLVCRVIHWECGNCVTWWYDHSESITLGTLDGVSCCTDVW